MQPKYAAVVKAAIEGDVQMWAFWQRLLGRQKPIDTDDPEFPFAWKLLEGVIGQPDAEALLIAVLAERQ